MTRALRAFDIDVEALHHEFSEGQHEIDFRYGEALTVADHVVTFKFVIKAIAHMNDLHATFMPNPIPEINGSGLHVHQSLFRDGENVFYSKVGKRYHLSDTASYFIGGQMHHVRALASILCPTVNSYKRLVPGFEAPINVLYSRRNRSALIRIPMYLKGEKYKNRRRIEYRGVDPSTNPYFAFAAILSAGLDGIKKKTDPGDPVDKDVLAKFYKRARPFPKFWKPIVEHIGDPKYAKNSDDFYKNVRCWILGLVLVYSSLFSIGKWIFGETSLAIVLTFLALFCGLMLWWELKGYAKQKDVEDICDDEEITESLDLNLAYDEE